MHSIQLAVIIRHMCLSFALADLFCCSVPVILNNINLLSRGMTKCLSLCFDVVMVKAYLNSVKKIDGHNKTHKGD